MQVLLDGPAQEFHIVGLFGLGDLLDVGCVTFAVFDLETGQQVFEAPGSVDAMDVTVEPGVTNRGRCERRILASSGPASRW